MQRADVVSIKGPSTLHMEFCKPVSKRVVERRRLAQMSLDNLAWRRRYSARDAEIKKLVQEPLPHYTTLQCPHKGCPPRNNKQLQEEESKGKTAVGRTCMGQPLPMSHPSTSPKVSKYKTWTAKVKKDEEGHWEKTVSPRNCLYLMVLYGWNPVFYNISSKKIPKPSNNSLVKSSKSSVTSVSDSFSLSQVFIQLGKLWRETAPNRDMCEFLVQFLFIMDRYGGKVRQTRTGVEKTKESYFVKIGKFLVLLGGALWSLSLVYLGPLWRESVPSGS